MRCARWVLAGTAAALMACGDGGGNLGPPPPVDMNGGWSFTIRSLTTPGLGFSCGVTGTMQLQQSGDAFGGTYHISSFSCTNGFNGGPGGGSVVSGQVFAGDSVHFHFDTEDLDQHGVVYDNRTSMAGSSTWTTTDGTTTVVLTGSWTAKR